MSVYFDGLFEPVPTLSRFSKGAGSLTIAVLATFLVLHVHDLYHMVVDGLGHWQ